MFETEDENYLLEELKKRRVVLFLGAGFSTEAFNLTREKFPTGNQLGQKLWDFLGYEGEYDGTSLSEMYQAFLSRNIDTAEKEKFLQKHLFSSDIPQLYDHVTIPAWAKIYSTNVDDILEKVYTRNSKKIREIKYPCDDLENLQEPVEDTEIIYLHGKLPCDPREVIFSPRQYAKVQYDQQTLYDSFVHDYHHLPTIFVGTELNEPLFERYIVAREERFENHEDRPKSFLITPCLSPVKADNLREHYNVHFVTGTTEDFLNWLSAVGKRIANKAETE